MDFYALAFGFEKRLSMPGPDGRTGHAEMSIRDAIIMFGPPRSPELPSSPAQSGQRCPVGLYVYCDDVDALFARATSVGAKPIENPQDMFWGDRMCKIQDPDGYEWSFATNVSDFDPDKVPH
jgi:PhnB protein